MLSGGLRHAARVRQLGPRVLDRSIERGPPFEFNQIEARPSVGHFLELLLPFGSELDDLLLRRRIRGCIRFGIAE